MKRGLRALSLSSVWRTTGKRLRLGRLFTGRTTTPRSEGDGSSAPQPSGCAAGAGTAGAGGARSSTAVLADATNVLGSGQGARGAPCGCAEAEQALLAHVPARSSSPSAGDSGTGGAGASGLFPALTSSTGTGGSLVSCGASSSRQASCATQLFADPAVAAAAAERRAAAAIAAQAAAATAQAELACVLAPLLPPARRGSLAHASMGRLVQLVGDVAEAADGRALLELLTVASQAARLSPELRAATQPAAVALLSAACARIKPMCAERLPLEMRVPRTAALLMHGTAERAWLWAPRACDPRHLAALAEEGRQYLRSLWNFYFSDLPGWTSPWQLR